MNCFLDSSALLKLYREEELSAEQDAFLFGGSLSSIIVLSEIARIEFATATWRKTLPNNRGIISQQAAETIVQDFEADWPDYYFIGPESRDFGLAKQVVSNSHIAGFPLRSLDAIQLAAALSYEDVLDAFVTFDKRLIRIATFLGLPLKTFTAAN